MEDKEILEMNNGKKFDIILMNPPYSNTNDILHLKFVDKCLDISNKLVVIMPFMFATQPLTQKIKKFRENFNKRLISVEQFPSTVFNDVKSIGDVGIYTFKENSNNVIVKFKNGETTEAKNLNELTKFNNYENQFIKYLNNNGDIEAECAGFHDHCTITSLEKRGITDEKEAWKIIDKDIENNCKKLKEGKYFLQISENDYGQHGNFFEKNTGNIFNSKEEVVKFMQKHGRSSTRGYIFIMFDSEKEAKNCKEALKRPLMRLCLYKTEYNKLIRIKYNLKYIPDIDWEDDRVNTDEGLLELCGCPKDKCKEYAEYCKKIIDEVDKK